MGRWEEARDCYLRCLAWLEIASDPKDLCSCLYSLGRVQRLKGDYASARQSAEKMLGLSEYNPAERARAYELLAVIETQLGRYPAALDYYRQAAALAPEESNQLQIAYCYLETGDYLQAETQFKAVLSSAKARGDPLKAGACFLNLAIARYRQRDLEEALDYLNQARGLFHSIKHLQGLRMLHNYYGIIFSERGMTDQALEHYHLSLKISRQLGDLMGLAETLNNLGNIYLEQGQYSSAEKYLDEALILCRRMEHPEGTHVVSTNLGIICLRTGRLPQAEEYLEDSIAFFRREENKYLLSQALRQLAELRLLQERPREAERLANETIDLARQISLSEVEFACQILRARSLADTGQALSLLSSLLPGADPEPSAEIRYWIQQLAPSRENCLAALESLESLPPPPLPRKIDNRIEELKRWLNSPSPSGQGGSGKT